MKFSTLSIFVVFAFLIGCSSAQKSGIGTFKTPEGWSKSEVQSLALLTAPEKDMNIYFHKEPVGKDFDFSKKSVDLWKKVRPGFSYKELQTTTPPSKNWDKVSQIVYQVPAEESKMVLTLMRVKDGIGYFNLMESSSSTLNKRAAQMMQVFESWKPETIKDEDFSSVKPKQFASVEKEFEGFLVQAMKDLKIPGMTIGVVQDGQVVYQKGFGSTKTNGGTKVNKDTLFMIGSTTKPLTTLLMSKLVHDGKIKWDDPIGKHLKGWSLKNKAQSKNYLIKHSACACTGMPRRDLDFIFDIDGINAEKRMQQMSLMSPTTKPGETFSILELLSSSWWL